MFCDLILRGYEICAVCLNNAYLEIDEFTPFLLTSSVFDCSSPELPTVTLTPFQEKDTGVPITNPVIVVARTTHALMPVVRTLKSISKMLVL